MSQSACEPVKKTKKEKAKEKEGTREDEEGQE